MALINIKQARPGMSMTEKTTLVIDVLGRVCYVKVEKPSVVSVLWDSVWSKILGKVREKSSLQEVRTMLVVFCILIFPFAVLAELMKMNNGGGR